MSITRIYSRTFQNDQHAEMSISIASEKLKLAIDKSQGMAVCKIYQNPEIKHQIITVWEYASEEDMKKVQKSIKEVEAAAYQESLNPKVISYTGVLKFSHASEKD